VTSRPSTARDPETRSRPPPYRKGSQRPLVRELAEEIGIKPSAFEEIAVLEEPRPAEHGEAQYQVFIVTAWDGGEPHLLGSEHSELRWLSLASALALPLAHPGYGDLFRAILSREREGDI
jgi:8-oxo-dGTP diphosphatase